MDFNFNLIGCASWTLEIDNTIKIGCDPGLAPKGTSYIYKGLKTSRVEAPVYDETTFENIKLWLLTHDHFDHLDELGLSKIENGAQVISRKNCTKLLKKRNDLDVTYLEWNEAKTIEINDYNIKVKAIPAVHGMNFIAKLLMGDVNGYLVTITNKEETKTIYVTSDTVFRNDIIETINNRKIDVLIANMGQAKSKMFGGPFTMNTEMLHKFKEELKPTMTLPIHTEDFAHFETSRAELKKSEQDDMKILENGETIKFKA
ncbi:MAG: MBL fold metallo-hydrolase [bacterium]